MSRFPHEPGPHWGEVGIHGIHRPRRWDAIALVDAPDAEGEDISFVALTDGSYVVERGGEDVDLQVFASGLALAPPYRAEAVRRDGTTWAVGASAIVVAELGPSSIGEEIEVVWDGVERATRIDGVPSFASVPALDALAAGRYRTWVARARRLRGASWEVEVGPL